MLRTLALLVPVLLFTACDAGDLTRDATSAVVGLTVETGKGLLSGVADGVAAGRADESSRDGSTVLVDPTEVMERLTWSVHAIEPGASVTRVVLAVGNPGAEPLRVAALSRAPDTLAIDTEGFAHTLVRSPGHLLGEAIDVPPGAKVKVSLEFEGSDLPIAEVRVAGHALDVP